MANHPTIEEICNLALAKLGQYSINYIYDNSEQARLCRMALPLARRQVLRAHNWNFATRFAQLLPNSDSHAVKYPYAHDLPAKWIRHIRMWADEERGAKAERFNIAGQVVHSEYEHLYEEYIEDACDPNLWDVGFVECVATLLAAKIAPGITGSRRLGMELQQEYLRTVLPDAITADSQDDRSNENNPTLERLRESLYIQQNQIID